MPKKKGPTGKRRVNKSQFVREQPAGISARDVVDLAKAQGITLSEKYVYNIRAKAKARGRKGVAGPGRPGRPPAAARAAGSGSAEERLVDLALEVGLGKAEALLGRLRNAIRKAVVG